MDSINHHTCPKGTKGDGQTPMIFIKPGGLYKIELVCKGGTAKMARTILSRIILRQTTRLCRGFYFEIVTKMAEKPVKTLNLFHPKNV